MLLSASGWKEGSQLLQDLPAPVKGDARHFLSLLSPNQLQVNL